MFTFGVDLLSSHQPHAKSLIASAESINVQVFLIHFTFSSVEEAMDDREVATSVASSAGILIAIHMLSQSMLHHLHHDLGSLLYSFP